MKKVLYCLVAVVFMAGLVLGCAGTEPTPSPTPAPSPTPSPTPTPAPAPEKVTLKAISFLPVDHPVNAGAHIFTDIVNERGEGNLVIDFFGGPEVIPGFDQGEAVKTGAMDMIYNVTAYYAPMLPAADTLHLTEYTPWEERENGLYEFMVELHKEINAYYIGRWSCNQPFYLQSAKPIERPADLASVKMRTAALYDEFMRALGIIPVTLAMSDVYSALERGIIDGFGWPIQGAASYGWNDRVKYCIDHPFYEQNNTILINLDLWNRLPKEYQDLLLESAIDAEKEMWDVHGKQNEEARKESLDLDVNFVKFSPADAKYYVDLAYSTSWAIAKEKVDPVTYTKLEQLLRK